MRKSLFLGALVVASAFADPIIITGPGGYTQITFTDNTSFANYFSSVPGAEFVSLDFNTATSTGGTFGTTLDHDITMENVLYLDPVTGHASGGDWTIQNHDVWIQNMHDSEYLNIKATNRVILGYIADYVISPLTSGLEVISPGQLASAAVTNTGTYGVAFFPNTGIDSSLENGGGFDISVGGLDMTMGKAAPQYFEMSNLKIVTAPIPPPNPSTVPEPSSWAMMAGGLIGLAEVWRRRRHKP